MAKSSKILTIIAIALAVLIGGTLSAYAFCKPFKNAVDSAITNPEKLYQKADRNYFSSTSKSLSGTISKVNDISSGKNEYGLNNSLKITLGDELIKETGIKDLKSVSINSSYNTIDKKIGQNYSVNYNDKKLLSVNASTDIDKKISYIQVPELSDAYVSVKADELPKYLKQMGVSLEQFTNGMNINQYLDMLSRNGSGEQLLTPEQFEDIIKRYSDIFVKSVTNVKKDTVKGEIDGVSYKYTCLTADLTFKDLLNISEDLLNELKKDDVIKDLFVKQGILKDEDYASGIDSAIAQLKEAKDNPSAIFGEDVSINDKAMTMKTYLDSNQKVVGKEFLIEDKGINATLGYINVDNDKNNAIKAWVKENDEELFSYEGSGKKNDGALTGEYKLTVSDGKSGEYTINFSLEDYKVIDEKEDLISGKITISADIEDVPYEVVMNCSVKNKKQTVEIVVNTDKKMFVTIEVTYEKTDVSDIKTPGANDKIYDGLDETQQQEYLATFNLEAFKQKVTSALGEDLANQIFNGMANKDESNNDKSLDDILKDLDESAAA